MKFKVTPSDRITRLLFSTTRITTVYENNSEGIGTGFFYNSGERDYLVTNKHVIEGAIDIVFQIHSANKERPQYANLSSQSTYHTTLSQWVFHPDSEIDLVCIPVNDFMNQSNTTNDSYFYVTINSNRIPDQKMLDRFSAVMDVAMIGYPEGLWDEANGLPIIRQGATASHAAVPFNGKDEVLLDIACFPGSSGSPIILHNTRYFASAPRFLGILYAGPTTNSEGELLVTKIPTSTNLKVTVLTMMHLGYAIKASVLQEFVVEIENQ